MLDNREWVTFIYLCVALLTVLSIKSCKIYLIQIVKQLLDLRFVISFICFCGYAGGVIWLANEIGIWKTSMLKDSIFTIIFVGLPITVKLISANDPTQYFKKVGKQIFGLGTFISFYINSYSFNFLSEFAIQTLIIFFGIILVVPTENENSFASLKKLSAKIVSGIGLLVIIVSTAEMATHWNSSDWEYFWKRLALSVWICSLIIPFAYVLSFIIGVAGALPRSSKDFRHRKMKLRIRFAIFLGFGGNLFLVKKFAPYRREQFYELDGFLDARKQFRAFKLDLTNTIEEDWLN